MSRISAALRASVPLACVLLVGAGMSISPTAGEDAAADADHAASSESAPHKIPRPSPHREFLSAFFIHGQAIATGKAERA